MDAFADKLGAIGAWCGQNKYLSAIKNAFQDFMPATIAGAIGVLWTNVLINDGVVEGNAQGLGGLIPQVMAIEPYTNPIFSAIQFATISCITIGITMLVAQEIGVANGEKGTFPAIMGFLMWLVVTPTSFDLAEGVSFTGISSSYTGATGLFTGLIIGILGMELYNAFRKMDALKIKMPDQVPPGVARAFEVLIPCFITLLVVGAVGHFAYMATGSYLNDLIAKYVQEPLINLIGANIFAVMCMYVLISLFWLVGIHGNNMLAPVKEAIFKPMLYANTAAYKEHQEIPNIFNMTMLQMFSEWGGSGVTLGLVIAIFIFGKREENKAIATLSIVPGLFNINETVTFGIPLVLNPILGIPFILAPCVCIFIGWLLISIGFCPRIVLEVPWTMPPLLLGFLATGANIMGAISQLIVIVVATLIYIPFLLVYERQQAKNSAE